MGDPIWKVNNLKYMNYPSSNDLSREELLDILSNNRRRFILYYLDKIDNSVELSVLSREIALWETNEDVSEISENDIRRVYISIYQTHLPKLEQFGFIKYDEDDRVVKLSDRAKYIPEYLGIETVSNWEKYYVLIGILWGGLLFFNMLNFPIISDLNGELIAASIVVSIFLIAIIHYLYLKIHHPRSSLENLVNE